jgi:excisionase family DNA binding protein
MAQARGIGRVIRIASGSSLPRVTLTKAEAADALGISLDHLERHVLPDLRVIRSGRRVLIRLGELERWAQQQEAFSLAGDPA